MHRLVLFLCAALLPALSTSLASGSWTGGGSNDFWSTGANWSDGQPPVNNGTASIYFNGPARTMPDLDLNWSVGEVRHNNSSSPFTLRSTAGRVLTTASLGSLSYSISGGSARFTVNVSLQAAASGISLFGSTTVNGSIQTQTAAQLVMLNGSSNIEELNIAGTISGPAALRVSNTRNRLTGNSALTGSTTLDAGASLVVHGAAGSLSSTPSITLLPASSLTLGDTATTAANPNRINDAATIDSYAAALTLFGSNNAATTRERVGAITLSRGDSTFTLRNAAVGQQTELVGASITRQAGTALLLLGDNLGQAGASTTRFLLDTAPLLVGPGGAAGTTKVSIVPWAVSGTSTSDPGSGLVTYGANGFRPLNPLTEYAPSIALASAGDNVRVAAAGTVTASKDINSVVIDNGASVTIQPGQTLFIGSGAVLMTSGGTISGGTLHFGREGIIRSVTAAGNIASQIAGSGGLTTNSTVGVTLSGNNSYTGATYVNGILNANSNTALGAGGPANQTVITPNSRVRVGGATTSSFEWFEVPLNPTVSTNSPATLAFINIDTAATLSGNFTFTGAIATPGRAATLHISDSAGATLTGTISSQTTGSGSVAVNYAAPQNARAHFNATVTDGSGVVALQLSAPTAGGSGIIAIQNANTHTGGTSLGIGSHVLFNNTTGSGSGAGGVGLDFGATLGGTGRLDPAAGFNVGIGGGGFGGASLSPGDPAVNNGVGTLTIGSPGSENDLIIVHRNHVRLQVGSVSDMVQIFGGLQFIAGPPGFGGNISFHISDAGDATPGTYPLLAYTTAFTGLFDIATIATLPAGWSASLVHNLAGQSIDLQLHAVPEPATTVLLGAGLLVLAARLRQRMRRSE